MTDLTDFGMVVSESETASPDASEPTIDDPDPDPDPVETPNWTPGSSSTNTRCQNCDHPVSKQFALVFGDSNDVLHHCAECSDPEISFRDLKQGAGSNPDYHPETHRGTSSDHHPLFNIEDSR